MKVKLTKLIHLASSIPKNYADFPLFKQELIRNQ